MLTIFVIPEMQEWLDENVTGYEQTYVESDYHNPDYSQRPFMLPAFIFQNEDEALAFHLRWY